MEWEHPTEAGLLTLKHFGISHVGPRGLSRLVADTLQHMKGEPRRHLTSCTLNSVAEAVDAFEEDKGLLVCQIRPSTFSNIVPFFSVPQGYYALVQRGGKFANFGESGSPTWPPGIHFGALKRVS